jgi:hypothetical protein
MDQVQVEIVEVQAPQAGVERPFGLLVAVVVVEALARYEHFLALEPRASNRLTDSGLVAVYAAAVSMWRYPADSACATTAAVSRGGT